VLGQPLPSLCWACSDHHPVGQGSGSPAHTPPRNAAPHGSPNGKATGSPAPWATLGNTRQPLGLAHWVWTSPPPAPHHGHSLGRALTEVGRVVVCGAVEAKTLQVGDEVRHDAFEDALALAQDVQLQEEARIWQVQSSQGHCHLLLPTSLS